MLLVLNFLQHLTIIIIVCQLYYYVKLLQLYLCMVIIISSLSFSYYEMPANVVKTRTNM